MASACLTDGELARLRESAPGAAPPQLAAHLAGCTRCQSRALFGAARSPGARREPPRLPSLRRMLAMIAVVLLAMAALFWSLAWLTGRGGP